ncbi:MAG: tripartite tricarboxylate transporter permease [Candidatus Micrarchaeia archaeon]|jgi:putative membrane protein
MLQLLAALIIGILLGLFAGLVPGLHPNTLSAVLANIGLPDSSLPFIILSLAASAGVFEMFRAIFLYVPDATTVISVLPGHRMLMEGKGMLALRICCFALVASTAFALLLLPLSFTIFPLAYSFVSPYVPYLLLAICLALLLSEKKAVKIAGALACFLLAGVLGLIVFTLPIVREPLFPSFAGLFAISGLALSMSSHEQVPVQNDSRSVPLSLLPVILIGVLLGGFADLLPGLSSAAQLAVLASIFTYMNPMRFLALASSISASHLVFGLSALLTTGKARAGTLAIAGKFVGAFSADWVYALAFAMLVSTALAAILLLFLSRRLVPLLQSVDSMKLNSLVLAYLLCLIVLSEGANGLAVAAVASFIGILPPILGVRRTHLMGFILLPSILRPLM